MSRVTLCRLCGTLAPGMVNVEDDDDLVDLINEFVPSTIAQIEGFPNTICQRCREHLMLHGEFIEACKATERDVERRMMKDGGTRISRVSWSDLVNSQGGLASRSGFVSQSGLVNPDGYTSQSNQLNGRPSQSSPSSRNVYRK